MARSACGIGAWRLSHALGMTAASRTTICRVRKRMSPMDDATLQSLQSLIASELGVTAALQSGFTTRHATPREDECLPDVYLRLALTVVVGATLFRSLAAHAPRRAPERAGRRDDPLARPVPTPAPGVVTPAIRGKDR